MASQEYFSVLKNEDLDATIITPVFKEQKGDKPKTIVVYTKKARGMMARFIIANRINNPENIKNFNLAGYAYDETLSSDKEWLFIRHS